MEARYLILARYAEFTSDGMLNVLGGDHNQLVSEEYPYVHKSIICAARIVLNRGDCASEHHFRTVIVDDVTKEIIAEGVSGTIPVLVMPVEANFMGTGLLLQFQHVIFPTSSVYEVQLFVDETVLATARLRVAPIAYYLGRQKSVQTT